MGYTCNYLLKSGKVCGHTCYRATGCGRHWKSRVRFPCKVCDIPTSSKPGLCRNHCGSYYVQQYYKRMHEKAMAYDLLLVNVNRNPLTEKP